MDTELAARIGICRKRREDGRSDFGTEKGNKVGDESWREERGGAGFRGIAMGSLRSRRIDLAAEMKLRRGWIWRGSSRGFSVAPSMLASNSENERL